jgi:hypothetical protein
MRDEKQDYLRVLYLSAMARQLFEALYSQIMRHVLHAAAIQVASSSVNRVDVI